MRFALRPRCSHGQTQFETLCADAYLNPELNQIMIKAFGYGGWKPTKGPCSYLLEMRRSSNIINEIVIGNGYVSKLGTAHHDDYLLHVESLGTKFQPIFKFIQFCRHFSIWGLRSKA